MRHLRNSNKRKVLFPAVIIMTVIENPEDGLIGYHLPFRFKFTEASLWKDQIDRKHI